MYWKYLHYCQKTFEYYLSIRPRKQHSQNTPSSIYDITIGQYWSTSTYDQLIDEGYIDD